MNSKTILKIPKYSLNIEISNIKIKSLKTGTKFKTLDDEIIELSNDDLMICSENKPLCIAGIYGGLASGVSKSTKNLKKSSPECFGTPNNRAGWAGLA